MMKIDIQEALQCLKVSSEELVRHLEESIKHGAEYTSQEDPCVIYTYIIKDGIPHYCDKQSPPYGNEIDLDGMVSIKIYGKNNSNTELERYSKWEEKTLENALTKEFLENSLTKRINFAIISATSGLRQDIHRLNHLVKDLESKVFKHSEKMVREARKAKPVKKAKAKKKVSKKK